MGGARQGTAVRGASIAGPSADNVEQAPRLMVTLLVAAAQHEDFHLSLSTLSFNSLMSACYPPATPSPPLRPDTLRADSPSQQPQERTVSVDDVLRDLDEALQWVQEAQASAEKWAQDEKVLEQLRLRLMMRIVRTSLLRAQA